MAPVWPWGLLLALVLLQLWPCEVEACRVIAYAGEVEVSARALLLEVDNSLPHLAWAAPFLPGIRASTHYSVGQVPLRNAMRNKDGWGVGWYDESNSFPLRFRSPDPIVEDDNTTVSAQFLAVLDGNSEVSRSAEPALGTGGFTHSQGFLDSAIEVDSCSEEPVAVLTEPLSSKTIFGHVRAATESSADESNSHPFMFGSLMWMHNGALHEFESYREQLIRRLRPGVRGLVTGDTDSEHAGALMANNLEGFPHRQNYTLAELRSAMRTMVAELRAISAEASLASCVSRTLEFRDTCDVDDPKMVAAKMTASVASRSSMNFMLADGRGALVVTRFRSSPDEDPPSLYYKLGLDDRYLSNPADDGSPGGTGRGPAGFRVPGIIVASEPQDVSLPALSAWRLLGKDKMLSFHPSQGVRVECLSSECTPDMPADVEMLEVE